VRVEEEVVDAHLGLLEILLTAGTGRLAVGPVACLQPRLHVRRNPNDERRCECVVGASGLDGRHRSLRCRAEFEIDLGEFSRPRTLVAGIVAQHETALGVVGVDVVGPGGGKPIRRHLGQRSVGGHRAEIRHRQPGCQMR
jgi:hypothetical protein